MSQYKAMAKIIGQILGISIANARKYKVILKQKDLIENYSIELQKTNNSKDKFFSIIAHDLKSPFNSLLGFSELLNDEINEGNNANVEKYVSFIHKTLNDTFNLLVNLLEWAQSQLERIEFKPELIQLFETTHEIVNLLASQADKKGIDLEINIPKETQIFADKNMLNTILRNLVSNAIKYVKNNGKVIISSSAITDYTQICVRDTGIGMTPKNLEKLFSLETTESKPGTSGEKGTGLGLLLCKEFVEKHGGKIWAESEFGNGSKFTFTIPQE